MSGDNAIPEALPPSEKRRRVKKPKKAVKLPELSQENVTTAAKPAIAGSSTQQMGVLLIATPVTNHDMLTKGVTVTGQAAIAPPPQIVAPLSMKSPTAYGSITSVDREAGANRPMLGL